MSGAERVCWVVTDGRRGIENQALGLAEAIARRTPLRIVRMRTPRARPLASVWLRPEPTDLAAADAGDPQQTWAAMALHEAPWPDLWIGCGRASTPYSEAVRAWSGRGSFVVQLQDPQRPAAGFDLIVPPLHDEMAPAPNVTPILGSPNRVTSERLMDAARAFEAELAGCPRPRVAALVGGNSKRHRFTHRVEQNVSDALEALADHGASLLITTSRRTPARLAEALKKRFASRRTARVWTGDEDGPNPYLAFLAAADAVITTKDSVNMIAEAASAARPVLLLDVAGRDGKLASFYGALAARGNVRPFSGALEMWPVEPLLETDRAAEDVLERLNARAPARARETV
ncbi:MAG: mitochondrial fission ELM1 family protein [Caulobacterales bacterium]|nr:mitochondrial fission ELM1 family protein [Caulobacterales bacterium]